MSLRKITLVAALVVVLAAGGACTDSGQQGHGATPLPTATPGTTSPTVTIIPAQTGTATASAGTAVAGTVTTVPPSPSVTVAPSATVTPVPTMDPSVVRLKYVLFDRFGRLWYCDSDFYPVARQDEQTLAEGHFPAIEADTGTFAVILAHLGYAPAPAYAPTQQLAVYRDWKMLRALQLDPVSGSRYHFNARFTRDERTGLLVEGTIDAGGGVMVTSQAATGRPNCPICLARGTRIATPNGPIDVEALRVGMTVWTAGPDGLPFPAAVLAVGSTPVPESHQVVHLVLADGRELRVSPGHPLADGRLVGDLAPGVVVDQTMVVSAALEDYDGGATFDLLPAGPTATYWADGVTLRSTLAHSPSAGAS